MCCGARRHNPTGLGHTVKEVTRGKTYRLEDTAGNLLDRRIPLDQTKLVSRVSVFDQPQSGAEEKAYVVERVLDHQGPEGSREYLVKWRGYGASQNTWEPATHFDDLQCITDYWASLKG